MTSKITQIVKKQSIKPKEQYSPSNPTTTPVYHLVAYADTGHMMIVGNSSVKRLLGESTLLLNDGRTGKIIFSGYFFLLLFNEIHEKINSKLHILGTKDKCIKQWNKRTHSSESNS